MAVKSKGVITLADILAGRKGDGSFDSDIVELFTEENPILDDISIIEANDGTTNRTTIRTGIPEPTWTAYYSGVKPAKGTKTQVKDVAGRMKSMLEIDAQLYEDTPDKDQLLKDELYGLTEGMTQAMADCLIYGKIANEPRAFNGLYNFYKTAGADLAKYDSKDSAHYVFSGDKNPTKGKAYRSLLLMGWSPSTITTFYPKGHKSAGLQRSELRTVDTNDADGGVYQVKRQDLSWELGLSVRDYRYGGRIANIDNETLLSTNTDIDYVEMIHRLVSRVKNSQRVNRAFYMANDLWEKVQVLFYRKTMGNAVAYQDVMQRFKTPTLLGIPVRITDAMEVNEDAVTIA